MVDASAFIVGMAAAYADWGRSGRCPCLARAPQRSVVVCGLLGMTPIQASQAPDEPDTPLLGPPSRWWSRQRGPLRSFVGLERGAFLVVVSGG